MTNIETAKPNLSLKAIAGYGAAHLPLALTSRTLLMFDAQPHLNRLHDLQFQRPTSSILNTFSQQIEANAANPLLTIERNMWSAAFYLFPAYVDSIKFPEAALDHPDPILRTIANVHNGIRDESSGKWLKRAYRGLNLMLASSFPYTIPLMVEAVALAAETKSSEPFTMVPAVLGFLSLLTNAAFITVLVAAKRYNMSLNIQDDEPRPPVSDAGTRKPSKPHRRSLPSPDSTYQSLPHGQRKSLPPKWRVLPPEKTRQALPAPKEKDK